MYDIDELTQMAADNLDGCDWYESAAAEIGEVCESEGWTREQFTGILAVTSPRVSVRRNVRITLQYVGSRRFLTNVMQSIRVSINTLENENKIKGPKTSAFYAALMGDENAVVLDTHMANLFGVRPQEFSKKSRQVFVDAVCEVARRLEISPRDAQACLWYAQKRRVGENPVGFPIVEEYRNWLAKNKEFGDGKIDNDTPVAMPLFDDVPF